MIARLFVVVVALGALPAPAAGLPFDPRKMAEDFRLFTGAADPVYESGDQIVRRLDMRDALARTVIEYPGLDRSDPTAGRGGAAQHAAAALPSKVPFTDITVSDLGYWLRSQMPPRDDAERNFYAGATRLSESRLVERIRRSDRPLAPADLMRMALEVSDGNYTMATLTAANLLKNVAYTGRHATELYNAQYRQYGANAPRLLERQGLSLQPDEGYVVDVASRLANLRGDPRRNGDKLGPWYHLFSMLFLGSITSKEQAHAMMVGEHISRELRMGSVPDPEKGEWDYAALGAMELIHPVIYEGRPSPFAAAPPAADQPGGDDPVAGLFHSLGRAVKNVASGGKGKLRVTVSETCGDMGVTYYVKAIGGKEGERQVFDLAPGSKEELPAGSYRIVLSDALWVGDALSATHHELMDRSVEVTAGETTKVRFEVCYRKAVRFSVVDARSGTPIAGARLSISGTQSLGPLTAPAQAQLRPGSYHIKVAPVEAGGRRYAGADLALPLTPEGYLNPVNAVLDFPIRLPAEPLPVEPAPAAAPARIALDPGYLDLDVGDRYEVLAKAYDAQGLELPGRDYSWTSSDPRVARVDAGGGVSGVSRGKALITVRHGALSADLPVRVGSGAMLGGCRIVNAPAMLPARGGGITLRVETRGTDHKALPGVSIAWSGSNDTVARVNPASGQVTTDRPGRVTVTALVRAAEGHEVSCDADIEVEARYATLLVSGRVVAADGRPVANASVRAGGGPAVPSGGDGRFVARAGGGPFAEGAALEVTAAAAQGTGSARVRVDGAGKAPDVEVRLAGRAAPPAPPDSATSVVYVLADGYPLVDPQGRLKDYGQGKYHSLRYDANGLSHRHINPNYKSDWHFEYRWEAPPRVLRSGARFTIRFTGRAGEANRPPRGAESDLSLGTRAPNWVPLRTVQGNNFLGRNDWDAEVTDTLRLEHTYQTPAAPPVAAKGFALDVMWSGYAVVRYLYEIRRLPEADIAALERSGPGGPGPARPGPPGTTPPPPPAGTDPSGSRPGVFTLAGGQIGFEMAAGDVRYYLDAPANARPLKADEPLPSGATVVVGKDSRVDLRFPDHSVAHVGENSSAQVVAPEGGDGQPELNLRMGSAEIETPPGFEGLERTGGHLRTRTPHVVITREGTRYHAWVDDRGTRVEVTEGKVTLHGAMLARADSHWETPGKRSFPKVLSLGPGERAIAYAGPGGGEVAGASPPSPLERPDPWNDPRIQQLIDEWLRNATPSVAAERPGPWRYTDWGQVVGPGITAAGAPDHPAGWSRHQSLWAVRTKFDSLNLCTLGEFVERRIAGRPLEGCDKAARRPATPAWPGGASGTAPDFSGEWACAIHIGADTSALYPNIARSGTGYQVETLTSGVQGMVKAHSVRVEGGRLIADHRFTTGVMTLVLEQRGAVLTGNYRERRNDGKEEAYPLECRVPGEAGGAATPAPSPALAGDGDCPDWSPWCRKSRGLLDKIEAIPDAAWIGGRPDLRGGDFKLAFALVAEVQDPRLRVCAGEARRKGWRVVGFTSRNNLEQARWTEAPPFPLAVGATAWDTLHAIEMRSGHAQPLAPIPLAYAYLIDAGGKVIRSGPCDQLLGVDFGIPGGKR